MICLIDCGSGNLMSVYRSLKFLGLKVKISSNLESKDKFTHYILPGVGAFDACMNKLKSKIDYNQLNKIVLIEKNQF